MTSTANSSASDSVRGGSRFTLWHLAIVVEIVALLVTGYLAYVKIANVSAICVESGVINCEEVQSSAWSMLLGIPIAYLGFAAHVTIFAALLLERGAAFFRNNGPLLVFGLTLFGMIYHAYLIYVSIALIQAICPWCIAAAILMLVQFIISVVRTRRALAAGSD